MENISNFTRKRGAAKARVTAFRNYVEGFQLKLDNNEELTQKEIIELEQRLGKIGEALSDFEKYHGEIELLISEEQLEDSYKQRTDFEQAYFKITSNAQCIINRSQRPEILNYDDVHSVSSHSARGIAGHTSVNRVKLPVLKLPQFNGSYDKWLTFYDTFKAVIHSNDTISAIQKFQYLSSSLTGEAAQVIQSLEISAYNYEAAWQLLQRRYQNKGLMIHNHIKGIVEYTKITKQSFLALRELLNTVQGHMRALKALEQAVDSWDSLLIYIITDKFDMKTKLEWEKQQIKQEELSKIADVIEFLEKQCQLLEKTDKPSKDSSDSSGSRASNKQAKTTLSHPATKQLDCPVCNGQHPIFTCKSFLDMSIQSRIAEMKRHKRCLNCLRSGHIFSACKSQTCRKCQRLHNTLLHIERDPNPTVQNKIQDSTSPQAESNSTTAIITNFAGNASNASNVLPTAVIEVVDKDGSTHDCTVLLDSGSQSNFMAKHLFRRLRIPSSPVEINVLGVNQCKSNITEMVQAIIKSKHGKFQAKLTFLIFDKITSILPNEPLNLNKLQIPNHITLADPQFHKPKNIDILIGVDLFWELLCPEVSSRSYLHKTKLGYIVSGRIPRGSQAKVSTVCNFSVNQPDLSHQLRQFWELEECPRLEKFSAEEKACERIFSQTTRRNHEGRFIVTIPLKRSLDSLGESKAQAERRFLSLERKLQRNETMKSKYIEFMRQYETLGHMTKVTEEQLQHYSYYLPHHGVLKEESLTTKLRVVFDGSAPSTTGVSINDLQMKGPTIQQDLFSILLRFRIHSYVVGADISMMYRQVLVEPEQRPLQRILWRPSMDQPIETYNLNTVTYGLTSSSFLAIRCLMELANEFDISHPKAAEVIRKSMYVDDLLFSASTIEEAFQIREEVSYILATANFPLRKWISNDPKILKDHENTHNELQYHIIHLGENETIKTLGLSWVSTKDELIYKVNTKLDTESCTKRSILSVIARIYDPLGLLCPCIIIAKIILQRLWRDKSSWDEALTPEITSHWNQLAADFVLIENLRIPRQVSQPLPKTLEIHAFSDASEGAYGAAVYVRSIDKSGQIASNLLCAKSKVAPLKSVTIPRLELCAAHVAAKLVDKIVRSLDIHISGIYYWCDSTIVLSWLKLEPCTLKTFVSNRVSEIQSLSSSGKWYHVTSQENPADLLSRGVNPAVLQDSSLWWKGPSWLTSSELKISDVIKPISDIPDLKSEARVATICQTIQSFIKFKDFPDLAKLSKIIAYCIRFCSNLKVSRTERQVGHITSGEKHAATNFLIRLAQEEAFAEEIKSLKRGKAISPKSRLLNLNPFIHTDGVLRVGGRLANSDYDFNKQHPKILPARHPLTVWIFSQEHRRLLHTGPQTLLSCIRETYWPLSGRNLARKTVHDCLRCAKVNPKPFTMLMGHLPHDRVTPAPAFHTTGVDYAGPFLIKDRKGRGSKTSKCYVALFVCFASRAIHLELVSDLTADCFILALRRFASRWGMPSKIRSDNGTNFVGAYSELRELGQFLRENENCLNERLTKEHFNWSFIPAYSPHFGGIWEAGVKAMKYHLKRVVGNAQLTFEELYSVLAQIGAILNSRPLTPLSVDSLDLHPLTPAHLLIGRSLTTVPDPSVIHLPENHMSRYQRIQQIQQNFWSRWSKEYISELQCRTKWKTQKRDIQKGMLVLVKEDNLPPMKWQLGRITELHPGTDAIVRVVSLRTQKGTIKRAVTRLCPLPMETSAHTTE